MSYSTSTADMQQLLSTYRTTLDHHVHQQAIFGSAYVPAFVMHGIREGCSSIRRLKDVLREAGIEVEDRPNDDVDMVSFGEQIGVNRFPTNRFSQAKFEAYCDTWKSLQLLKIAGDELWIFADKGNIVAFSHQLKDTSIIVNSGSIFFEDDDYTSLVEALHQFGNFRIGKGSLIEMRLRRGEELRDSWHVHAQIAKNRQYKTDYDTLLGKNTAVF